MKNVLIIILLALIVCSCSSGELTPATVLARISHITDISIELYVIEILDYGHFMTEITIGDRIEVFTVPSYRDSTHLIATYREFHIVNEYGYWELAR